MKKTSIYKGALLLTFALFLAIVVQIFRGELDQSGPLIIGFFILFAIGVSGYESMKTYVFTILIFAGVSTSLYYPQYFTFIGDFKLTILIIPLIQIIMFGMGTSMSLKDFGAIFKSPKIFVFLLL